MHRFKIAYLILALCLAGCTTAPMPTLAPSPVPLETANSALAKEPEALPSLIPTWTPAPQMIPASATPPAPITIAMDPAAPATLREALDQLIQAQPAAFSWSTDENADVQAGFDPSLPLGEWVWALVGPFATILDGITWADLVAAWQGQSVAALAGRPLLVSPETAAALTPLLGTPSDVAVQQMASDELLATAWAEPPAWAIVPFEVLEPRWKVLQIDGLSPLDKPLDLAAYPLARQLGLHGQDEAVEQVWSALAGTASNLTNRDENRMTVLAMTGVTALVRATAYEMELMGMTYPGEVVAEVLQAADIAHISNEVSFAADCPYPNPARQDGNLKFCADDRYIELLDSIGVDVIELTGNHNNDWGTVPFSRTLSMYQERNWQTFGGGANAMAASQPLTISHNGTSIGFLGCNPVGPQHAWAGESSPGVAYCTIQSLAKAVTTLAEQVDIVVVGLQYYEHYNYAPTVQQKNDFMTLAQAGATIVNGSQGHHVQGFAFTPDGNGFIHYGVGNLFFDQMDQLGTRQTFIDRHILYDGRHIATDLWTGLIENWARPRLMTTAERAELLQQVFAASDW